MKPLFCVITFALGASEPTLGAAGNPASGAPSSQDSRQSAPTAQNQSNSPEDLKRVQKIRRALVKDDSLSTAAKNVQVISTGGKVTVRGSVKSAEEKARVLEVAKQGAAGAAVDDLLEISEKRGTKNP